MFEEPLISVIMPAYQAEQTIERAIDSILYQKYSNLELIVVNDGSTDDTESVARIALQETDRVTRLITIAHHGVVTAANEAISHAKGDFIARMDADDWSHPRRLRHQMKHLIEHDLDIVGSFVRIVDQAGGTVPTLSRYQQWINRFDTVEEVHAMRFVEYPMANPTVLAKRWVFELKYKEGTLDDQPFPEDYEWFLRAMAAGAKAGKVPEKLLNWTDSKTRLTRTDARYEVASFDTCRRHYLLDGPLKDCKTIDLWGAGQTGKPWMRWLQEHMSVRRLYDIDPRKIGQSIHGVQVSHPDEMTGKVDELKSHEIPLLIAVGAEGARDLIMSHIDQHGYQPGRDAWFVC